MADTRTQLYDPTAADPPPAGPLVGDRYELGAELAGGGMGLVYTARDRTLGRDVAVKVLRPELAGRPRVVARFVEEARIAAQLQHPGIAPVHDLGTLPDGRPFLAMKLIKGRNLADLLRERSAPSADLPRFLTIFEAVCQAVGYAHSRGVIHRDLKPANIMVGAFGEVQVMDWGLGKTLGSPDGDRLPADDPPGTVIDPGRDPDSGTQAGSLMGTPAYMPPEQAKGEVDRIDQRADVFALGAVLCEILTGQPPYVGSFAEVRAQAVMGLTGAALEAAKVCGADWRLITLCRHCLHHEPHDRPDTAAVVATRLLTARSEIVDDGREQELGEIRQRGVRSRTIIILCTLCLVDETQGDRLLADAWLRFTDSLSGTVDLEVRDFCRSLDRYGRPDLAYRLTARWLDGHVLSVSKPKLGWVLYKAWFAVRWACGSELSAPPFDPTHLADQAAGWLEAELDTACQGDAVVKRSFLHLLGGKSMPTSGAWNKPFQQFPHLAERRDRFLCRLAALTAECRPHQKLA